MDWYERVVANRGQAAPDVAMRFWLVPGFGHGSGDVQLRWNSLAALEAWVEEATLPENLVATNAAESTAGRTRPLCEYPGCSRLVEGATDVDSAESYSCVE